MGRKKLTASQVEVTAPRMSQPNSASGRENEILDGMLPTAIPPANEAHLGVAILEASDPAQLLELVADAMIRPLLLCRLSPNVALVDPYRASELAEVLLRRGHTPKIVKG